MSPREQPNRLAPRATHGPHGVPIVREGVLRIEFTVVFTDFENVIEHHGQTSGAKTPGSSEDEDDT